MYKVFKPLVANNSPTQKEVQLDKQLKYWKMKNDTLAKACSYVNEERKVVELITKWKNICQMASNYLYNDFSIKIERIGGYKKFQIREWEKLKESKSYGVEEMENNFEIYVESDEFKMLSGLEQQEVIDNFNDFLKTHKPPDKDVPEFTDEFTMRDLYKLLHLDYSLVYE